MLSQQVPSAIRARLADLVEDDNPDDIRFARRLIDSFVERWPGMLAELTAAVDAGDAPAAARRAHALKGAAANLGVDDVAGRCAEVEARAEGGCLDAVGDDLAGIRAELPRAGRHLEQVLASWGSH